jgi:uracil phosphoribosyltransferase
MEIYNFSTYNSIYNQFLSELRNVEVQNDRMRFRRNLQRLGELSAYEISKTIEFETVDIKTPLGIAPTLLPSEQPVLATILRAGLPLQQGLLNYFDKADNCYISAYRKHSTKENFDVEIEYLASPSVSNKVVILNDPMLASGKSMVLAYKALLKKGVPKKIHIVSVIASQEGVDFIAKHFPENTSLWVGAIDSKMTKESYIVPGLGDAGDLAFGSKED